MSLAHLASFSTLGEAVAARSALEAAAISTYIADENTVAMNWMYSNAIGGVKLFVADEDLEQAGKILEEVAEDGTAASVDEIVEEPSEEAEEPPPALACPNCGSSDIVRIPRLLLFAALSVVIIAVSVAVHESNLAAAGVIAIGLILLLTGSHHCRNCGERWSAQETEGAIDAPPPAAADQEGMVCPRCGEPELHYVRWRRLRVLPLGLWILTFLVVPLWIFLPKKRCDHCGLRLWM